MPWGKSVLGEKIHQDHALADALREFHKWQPHAITDLAKMGSPSAKKLLEILERDS